LRIDLLEIAAQVDGVVLLDKVCGFDEDAVVEIELGVGLVY